MARNIPSASGSVGKNTDNSGGVQQSTSYGYLQSVRKEWKCVNGNCQESTTKCKNGACDSIENRFKADNYQPEIPKLQPLPIQQFPFPQFDFTQLFNFPAFPKFEFPAPPTFDNQGLIDLVLDTKNFDYYYNNAKFVNSKCENNVCVVKTRTCNNGKCTEKTATQKL